MKNPIAYFGFLGLLGFAGFFASPLLFSLFGNLFFFGYAKTIPDELFWTNIRRAATPAFFVFLVLANLILAGSGLLQASETLYHHAINLTITGFGITVATCIFVFIIRLMIIENKERIKDNSEPDN